MKNNFSPQRVSTRKGFALILAIAAMSFMVLLTLTLSSVITAKLRIINSQKELRVARSNALLGLGIAVSELQKHLGKDNAISVPATSFDSDAETLIADGVKTPFVFGSFSVETDMLGKSPLEAQNLLRESAETIRNGGDTENVNWFVSSEKRLSNPLTQNITDISQETIKLAEYYTLDDFPTEFGDSVNAALKSKKIDVLAGKIKFSGTSSASQSAYAWWVSDESLKAKLNLTRPEKYLDKNTDTPNAAKAPADTRLPQVVNTTFVEELAHLGLHPFAATYSEENVGIMRKIGHLDEFGILDYELGEWGRRNKNDWTALSVGIPADVSQGRLKEDLSVYMHGNYGLEDDEPIIRGSRKKSDEEYTGVNFGIQNFDKNLPTFGLLKTWTNFYKDENLKKDFNSGVKPRPHAINKDGGKVQHGIYPIVQRATLVFMPAFEDWDPWNPESSSVKISLLVWPRIWLWNPNNVKLESSTYVIRIYAPLVFAMGNQSKNSSDSTNYPLQTRWYDVDRSSGSPEIGDSTKFVGYSNDGTEKPITLLFSDFLKDRNFKNNPDGIPMLSFQVKDLEMKPGESVELCPDFNRGIDANTYVDMEIAEKGKIAGDYNVLIPRRMASEHRTPRVIDGSFLKIGINGNGKPMEFSNKSMPSGIVFTRSFDDTATHVPAAWRKGKNKTINSMNNVPYLEAWWRVSPWNGQREFGEDDTKYRQNGSIQHCRYGYDLWVENGGTLELLVEHDLNSYEDLSDTLKWHNLKDGISTIFGGHDYIHRIEPNNKWILDMTNQDSNPKIEAGKINSVDNFYNNDMSSNSIGLAENQLSFVASGQFDTDMDSKIPDKGGLGIAFSSVPAIVKNNNNNTILPIRIANLRGSQVVSGINTENALKNYVRRPSKDGIKGGTNIGYATLWTRGSYTTWNHEYRDMFGLNYSWPMGSVDSQSGVKLTSDKLIDTYTDADRYGSIPLFADPHIVYQYSYMIAALFDYPRDEHDVMSLGMFNHANLSPMMWQPTYAFGESRTSPHLDRENVYEQKILNENELLDISYALNASVWDRFFISTIPQDGSVELYPGMRMPNTRHVITSMPQDKKELFNSADAFKKSAAHVGVEGAFNVNSDSYEAWRAFLGGMLGTTKTTIYGKETINDKGDDPSKPEEFKMPNPGDMNPLYLPEEKQDFTYRDAMIGRRISEAEIDQLAREIVKEVKRRAPFFSLGEFVNRRLMTYADASTDIDLKYQSLMGTIAAAIHRASVDDSRPKTFFNNPFMDSSNNIVFDNSLYTSRTRKIQTQTKKDEPQYIEQAIGIPSELPNAKFYTSGTMQGFLQQADILAMIGPFITVRGDTFTIRAYGESKNAMTGTTSKAYCEAVVQRSCEPVNSADNIIAPESPFGRRFNIVSFRWLSPAEL